MHTSTTIRAIVTLRRRESVRPRVSLAAVTAHSYRVLPSSLGLAFAFAFAFSFTFASASASAFASCPGQSRAHDDAVLLELRRLVCEKGLGKMLWSGSSTGVVDDASSGLQAAMQGLHTTSKGSGLRRYVGVVHVREQASKSMATSPILHPQSSHTFSATIRWHMSQDGGLTPHQVAGVQRI
ncbi:hypothetical protein ACO1O0_001214 [Amphichorda felina]